MPQVEFVPTARGDRIGGADSPEPTGGAFRVGRCSLLIPDFV